MGPNQPAEVMPYGRRMPAFAITGLFATPRSEIWDMKGITYSFEQKFSRAYQRHLVKTGFRYLREKGGRLNPENPSFTYQNYAELLANIPTSLSTSYGAPPHDSNMDSYSFFIQDDWRLGSRFVLNAGLRYDYHGHVKVYPTTDVPVEIVNYEKFTDINKLDFGPLRDPMEPYNSDGNNFGPRVGFAWTVTGDETTVVRGGVGYLHSPHLIATVRQGAANPFVPFRIVYNRTESIAKRRDLADVHGRCAGDRAGRCGGTQIGLLDFRSGYPDAVYDPVDAQRPALVWPARWRQRWATSAPTGRTSRCSGSSRRRSTGRRACGRIRRSARRAATTSTAARRWNTTACRRRCASVFPIATRGTSTTRWARRLRRRAEISPPITSRPAGLARRVSTSTRTSSTRNTTAGPAATTFGTGSTSRSSTSCPSLAASRG